MSITLFAALRRGPLFIGNVHKPGATTMNSKQYNKRESDLPAGLSRPAQRALAGADYWRLEQLTEVSEAEIKQLHGIGPKALEQLRRALSTKGLSFADEKGKKKNMGKTPELHVLMTGLVLGEAPRWHDNRLWFSDWGAHEVIAVDLEGKSEVIVRVPTVPFCFDWLPDGRLLIVSGRDRQLLRR